MSQKPTTVKNGVGNFNFPLSPVTAATSGFPKNTTNSAVNMETYERNDHFTNTTEAQETE